MHAVERGDQVEAGGPQWQLLGRCQQRGHLIGVALAGGLELCQHGRRDVGRGQPRAAGQHSAQQPCVPARAAADIQASDGPAGQEQADRAHRRLVGGAQRLVDAGYPLEMATHRHRHLPRCLGRRLSPARHAQFTHCSPTRQARNPRRASPRPWGRPCTQACGPPACPAPSGHRGQRPAGELPRQFITRGGRGPRPAPARAWPAAIWTRWGGGNPPAANAILAAAARRCR